MKHSLNDIQFSKTRIAVATIIFIATCLGYYSFFYVMREGFRYMSITPEYDIWSLTSAELLFYNRIFAAFAIILGAGAALTFLIDAPFVLGRSVRKRTTLLNDFRVLNAAFLSWGSRLGFVFGMYFISAQKCDCFSLCTDYGFMLTLIIVVLYWQLWQYAKRLFRISLTKVFLPLTILFVALTFLLGSVKVVNLDRIEKQVLATSINANYTLELPAIDRSVVTKPYHNAKRLFLCYPKSGSKTGPPTIIHNREVIPTKKLDSLVRAWKQSSGEFHQYQMHVEILVDKSIQMRYVNELNNLFLKTEIFKFGYGVIIEGADEDYISCEETVFLTSVSDYELTDSIYSTLYYQYSPVIVEYKKGNVRINGRALPVSKIKGELVNVAQGREDHLFVFQFTPDLEFENYIKTMGIMFSAWKEHREKRAHVLYGRGYYSLRAKERGVIRREYPFRMMVKLDDE